MKTIINKLPFLLAFVALAFVSCAEDDETRVLVPVGAIELANVSGNTIALEQTDKFTLEIKLLPENANNTHLYKSFTYSTSDEGVFTVSSGVITANGIGTAILTVSTGSGSYQVQKKCMVEVTEKVYHVSEIAIPDHLKNLDLGVGAMLQFDEVYTVVPSNAKFPEVTVTSSDDNIVTVSEEGLVTAVAEGSARVTVRSVTYPDISGEVTITVKDPAKATFDSYLDRAGWLVYTSHTPVALGENDNPLLVCVDPQAIVDESDDSVLSMNKPGNGSVPAGDQVYIVIDMTEQQQFNSIRIRHRSLGNTMARLRVWSVSLYGCNDFDPATMEGDFELIQNMVVTSANVDGAPVFREIPLATTADYRYVKMTYDSYDPVNGGTMQISDIKFGTATW